MAVSYRCLGVTDEDILIACKSFSTIGALLNYLRKQSEKSAFLPYKKIVIEKTQTFATGPNAALWPDGQVSKNYFNVVDGKIPLEKINSVLIKKRVVAPKHDTIVRYSYIEKYAITKRTSVKNLPKKVDVVDFVQRLQKLDFHYLNCVLLVREVFDVITKKSIYYEQMLYNPAYITHDTMGVIMGSLRDAHTTIRYINKHDLPITKNILNHWLDDSDKINPKLIKFLGQNER